MGMDWLCVFITKRKDNYAKFTIKSDVIERENDERQISRNPTEFTSVPLVQH